MKQKQLFFQLISFLFLICINSQQHFDPLAWREAAKYLQEGMNKSYKPCENFFDHVCRNYKHLSNETDYLDYFSGKGEAVAEILVKAIKGINLEQKGLPKYKKAIKVFYDQCTSIEVDSKWPKRLYEAVSKRFGELSLFDNVIKNVSALNNRSIEVPHRFSASVFNPWEWLGRFQRELGTTVIVAAGSMSLNTEEKSCEKKLMMSMGAAYPSSIPLNASTARVKLVEMAENIGLDKSALESVIDPWLNKVMAVYDDWYNLTNSIDFSAKMIALVNMSMEAPHVDWKAFINGLLPENVRKEFKSDETNEIFLVSADLVNGIGAMFKKYDEDAVKSFLYLQALFSVADEYFGEMASVQLIGKVMTAQERCMEYALQYLAPAMAHLYFDAIGQNIFNWRHEIILLQRNIFSAFRFLLNSVDWLDAEDKEKVQQKVDAIKFDPGIPSWIADEEKLMKYIFSYNTSLDPFENEFQTGQTRSDHIFNDTLSADQNDESVEGPPRFMINAGYDSTSNSVHMLLGLMLPPLFNVTYPLPVKYGGLGFVIGHELMHAFDAHHIIKGPHEKKAWLKEETFRGYAKKKACYVREYSKNCYEDKGLCIDGERNIGENIADIDGLKVAYMAYKIATQVLGSDPPIPELLDYTNDQIFFLAFARTWCSKGTPTVNVIEDEHTPSKQRVDMAVRNMPMFAKAFKCPMGSKYVPVNRCSLWGDIDDAVKH